MDEKISIWNPLLKDGRALIALTGISLIFSGAFALFLTFSGSFLPHDVEHIGLTADELYLISPNLVKFMFHDRAAFGGVLLAIGSLYIWLATYSLSSNQKWAWWTLVVSGFFGFGSFLLYIGYGYLDWWHGIATLALLPIYLLGIYRAKSCAPLVGEFKICPQRINLSPFNKGNYPKLFLFSYAMGLISGGVVICIVGITTVFVPQDLTFIQLCDADIDGIAENLLGVIAHDRAGFGGGLFTTGVTTWLILVNAKWSRSLWDILFVSGVFDFSCAIGIHFYVGYTDFIHLSPAYLGLIIFCLGIFLSYKNSHAE